MLDRGGRPSISHLTTIPVTHVLFVPGLPRRKVALPRDVLLIEAKTVVELLREEP